MKTYLVIALYLLTKTSIKGDITGGSFFKNRFLKDDALQTFANVGPKMCIKRCMHNTDCKAINIWRSQLKCTLLRGNVANVTNEDIRKNIQNYLSVENGVDFTFIERWTTKEDSCWPVNTCGAQQLCVTSHNNQPICTKYATPCTNRPCVHGFCDTSDSSYICSCKPGYGGTNCEFPDDCSGYNSNNNSSGVYRISVNGTIYDVYCDLVTDGGGWTVFQKRFDGSVDFYTRTWNDYRNGFGSLKSEFWLGNELLHIMTRGNLYLMRVDLESNAGDTRYAQYSTFKLSDETDKYRLTIEGHSGTAADDGYGMTYNNNFQFSSPDIMTYCTTSYKGAWWYNHCSYVNLNARWLPGTYSVETMTWYRYLQWYGMKKTSMKIRKKINTFR